MLALRENLIALILVTLLALAGLIYLAPRVAQVVQGVLAPATKPEQRATRITL